MKLSLLWLSAVSAVVLLAAPAAARKIVPPDEYGRVVLNNYSKKAGLAPVVFEHWLHRALFTCRLCHIDIGFAMEAGATGVTAEHNSKGFYCGACHNGKRTFQYKKIFAACTPVTDRTGGAGCERCHSLGKNITPEHGFPAFVARLPKSPLGNGVDWEAAENKGLIAPVDSLEGVSLKRPPLAAQKDFSIESKGSWMSDVLFSHKKHALWNGCEVCHPEIFPSTKKGAAKYSMFQIFGGEYCGACHDKVAFPLLDCRKCHTKPVR